MTQPASQPLPEANRQNVYESAIDSWVMAILTLPPITAGVAGLFFWINGRPADGATMLIAAVVILVTTLLTTQPCRYTLTTDSLSIRCGMIIFKTIPYTDIETVRLSSSLASGPALSLKRVEVCTGKRSYVLSPKDREVFVKDIQDRMV